MDNEGHDPLGFGNVRSASRELDIETLTRPGGVVPVDIHTTAELVRHVLRLRAVEVDLRSTLSFVRAQRDHWHELVPVSDRVKFPFDHGQSSGAA